MRNQKEESLKHSKFQFQAEIRFTTVSPLAENNCFVENTLKVKEEQRNEVDIQHQRWKNFELSRFIPGPHKM